MLKTYWLFNKILLPLALLFVYCDMCLHRLSLVYLRKFCIDFLQLCFSGLGHSTLQNLKIVLYKSLFFKKVADLQACTFIKKVTQHWCFPVSIAEFLRTPILMNICRLLLWLLLNFQKLFSKNIFSVTFLHRHHLDSLCSGHNLKYSSVFKTKDLP